MRARNAAAALALGLTVLLGAPATAALAAPAVGADGDTTTVAELARSQAQSFTVSADSAPATIRAHEPVSITVRPAVVAPTSGALTDDFGPRISPTAGASSNHMGIDLAPGEGTPIVSAADGVVSAVQASDNGGLGVHVIVEHPTLGIRTVYGHALAGSISVNVGDVVQAGQQIAAVGNTGTSTGPHLHFEVRDAATGEAHDPQSWLAGHGVGL
ncbi:MULTISPECIES: M23 family metallopeptidase [unclassified Pseudoclavibacter]|uniref:M23 family metallopeptidase n=1 Tax=unclassified Pseudoclavibacter TaxID=2615177 RepID=UPI001BA53943|nr:M23 family metallopeptidase [Pseudoclavibacter sp. Marseille-Q4354]MBS3180036.1 M23 family metallopeptidase [Pseudoclavibacter sp. Marseille-Q4354]